jgi:hypothetical protein
MVQQTLSQKYSTQNRASGMPQMVEHEALSSNPNTSKRREGGKEKEKKKERNIL